MHLLYTLIIDLDGGTYVMQSTASSLDEAPRKCVESWDISEIKNNVSSSDKRSILAQLDDEQFILLSGITNVWCGSVFVKDQLAVMNLVRTQNAL